MSDTKLTQVPNTGPAPRMLGIIETIAKNTLTCPESFTLDTCQKLLSTLVHQDADAYLTGVFATLMRIFEYCRSKSTHYVSDGTREECIETSLTDVLKRVASEDWHTATAKCKHLKNGACAHGNPLVNGNHLFRCSHHLESLSAHSLMAAIRAIIYAFKKGRPDLAFLCGLCGLFHDIGKMFANHAIDTKKGTFMGFLGHAITSQMMMHFFWDENMRESPVSREEYFAMCKVIAVHMCGYHDVNAPDFNLKIKAFQAELCELSMFLLCALRYGDRLSAISNPQPTYEEQQRKMKEHERDQAIFESALFDSQPCQLLDGKQGTFVMFTGPSGGGKTFFANQLKAGNKHVVDVSRDECIAYVTTGNMVRLHGIPYALMYAIFAANKKLRVLMKAIRNFKGTEPIALEFSRTQQAWNTYLQAGHPQVEEFKSISVWEKGQDVPDMTRLVNDRVKALIHNALSQDKIVFFDTVANSWPEELRTMLPENVQRALVITIHCLSSCEVKGDRNGLSHQNQLALSGPKGPYSFASSSMSKFAMIRETKCDAMVRPMFVHVRVITPANSNPGNSDVMRMFARISTECDERKNRVLRAKEEEAEKKASECEMPNEKEDAKRKPRHTERVEEKKEEQISADADINFEGYDPLTHNMTPEQLITYLYRVCENEPSAVKDRLFKKHFTSSPFIKASATNKQLSDLSKEWAKTKLDISPYEPEAFDDPKLRAAFVSSIFVVNYIDHHKDASMWKPLWAKNMRGVVFLVNPETHEVTLIKSGLPRGAELASTDVKNKNLATEDVPVSGNLVHLDKHLQTMGGAITSSASLPEMTFMTSKVDGSAGQFTIVSGWLVAVLSPVIEIFGSDFHKSFAKMSLDESGGTKLAFPSTKGTFLCESDFLPYFITSLLCSADAIGISVATRENLQDKTPTDAWAEYGLSWMKKFFQLAALVEVPEGTFTITFHVEMVCACRQDAFGGAPHTELAVSYKRDGLLFLGVSMPAFTPHTAFASSDVPFQVPTFWTAQSGKDVNDLQRGFSKVISGEITMDQFLKMHRPKYRNHLWTELDFEGIVLFWYVDGKWMYAKAKTLAYYIAHKPKFHNGNEILKALAESGRFPNVENLLRPTSSSGVEINIQYIQKELPEVAARLVQLLNPANPDSPLKEKLAEAKIKIRNGDLSAVQKFVMNARTSDKRLVAGEHIIGCFAPSFPSLDVKTRTIDEDLQKIAITFLIDTPEKRTKKIAGLSLDDTFPNVKLLRKLQELCTA